MDGLRQLFVRRGDEVPAITGLRAISLLWVLVQHVQQGLRPLAATPEGAAFLMHPALHLGWAGNLGVDIFFVISGYLIGGMLMREREVSGTLSFRSFYTRRAMRLLPAYALAIVVYLAWGTPNPGYAWANVLFVNNFVPFTKQFMAHAWSLAIEEQFYALFPFFVLLLYRAQPRWRTPLVALTVAVFAAIAVAVVFGQDLELSFVRPNIDQFWRYMDLFYVKPHTRFGALFIGVLVVRLEAGGSVLRLLERRPLLAGLLAGVAVLTMSYVVLVFPECRAPDGARLVFGSVSLALDGYAFALAVGYLVLLSRTRSRVGRLLSGALGARVLRPIAQVSYTAYLLHPLCVEAVSQRLGFDLGHAGASYARLVAVAVLATLVASRPVYLLVERPVMVRRPPRPV
ncbi:acyltransferase [soil metagenome]